MADPNAYLHDPRRRNLAILAAIAIVTVVLAVLSLWHQASLVAPKYKPEPFFPKLAQQNRQIARIHVVSQKYGAFDVAFKPATGWVLPAEHDYPAAFSEVRKTIVGMAGLETIAPETKRADWLHYLHLDALAKGGKGTRITLLDEKGKVLASMIAGKTKDIGEPGGATGLFVRKPDSHQSWLVRSVFTPKPNPRNWMNTDIVDINRAQIREVDITPAEGPSYVVRRAKPSDSDFEIANMPKGRELSYPSAPDGPAAALVDFTFDHVAPTHGFDFRHGAELVTKTFDGLVVTTDVVHQSDKYWARISAETSSDKKAVQDEAHKINKAAGGWAFEIPDYKGAQFSTGLESLLKPLKAGKPGHKR